MRRSEQPHQPVAEFPRPLDNTQVAVVEEVVGAEGDDGLAHLVVRAVLGAVNNLLEPWSCRPVPLVRSLF